MRSNMKKILSTAEVPSLTAISNAMVQVISELWKEEENGSQLIFELFLNIVITSHFELLALAYERWNIKFPR